VADSVFSSPAAAIDAWCRALRLVETERVPLARCAGRVLAEPVLADRDSPPSDVSSMDGYAVRLADWAAAPLPLGGACRIGQPPQNLPPGTALRIVTGAAIPHGADAVVRQEDTTLANGCVALPNSPVAAGQYIRRQGENLRQRDEVVSAGTLITPAVVSALAAFGVAAPLVRRQVSAAVIVTGDEWLPPDHAPEPWQIRDSNGPYLQAILAACPRVALGHACHVPDDPALLTETIRRLLQAHDLLVLTGGVSLGDSDHVPAAVQAGGAKIIFHRLPIRPGHPILGAVGPEGQAVLALPGNPLSVMTGICRFGRAAVAHMTAAKNPAPPAVQISHPDSKTLKLWWYRPVTLAPDGTARLVATMGSGDIPSAARSDGFVEIPPESSGAGGGPWPLYRWEL
jgi:molybdopterin molybdotransferase